RKAAEHLADHWGVERVAVTRTAPGRITVRAVRTDPLTIPLTASTPRGPVDPAFFPLGIDEHGEVRGLRFRGVSGYGVYGIPGSGKTSLLLGLIAHYAECPEVQFVVLDGKTSTGLDGDYYDVADRCAAVTGDDLGQANTLLHQISALRRIRSGTIRPTLGTPNLWDVGPSPAWPLVIVIVDECHTYFQQIRDGGDKRLKERNALAAENVLLVEDLAKKGRSVGVLVIPATQKGTGDAIPTQIRDVLTGAVCFATRSDAAAVAALGEDIRQHPEAHPSQYVGEAYVGVATVTAGGREGFLRIRTPYCSPLTAAAAVERGAHLTARPDVLPGLTEGQAHRTAIAWHTTEVPGESPGRVGD
ncbi:cell division protein FtsK, partial [Nocardia higoensis]